ncbi:MAG: hypothetical protein KDK05_31330, partial [Candidatus Competibacteraceae bacterium]|nr:hypothetical protein [Candidatus Competibacteraceae bacterium]
MSEFTDFTEKDYQSYINLLRLAFDAVLNADTLEEAKRKAEWAAVGAIHSGYGEFEVSQLRLALEKIKGAQDLEEAVTIAYNATGADPSICPYCGDDRTGKGSLIVDGRAFCNEDH